MWVLRKDVADARYAEVENVDLEQTVSKFTARWAVQAKLAVDSSLVTLRLVPCGARKPTVEEEAKAVALDPLDSFDTLIEAGVTDGCKLLAYVAGARLHRVTAAACWLPRGRRRTLMQRARGVQRRSPRRRCSSCWRR